MPRYYTYLVSSLPQLQFGSKPPFSYAEFLRRCADCIPPEEVRLLADLAADSNFKSNQPVIKKWLEFERMLRNELVKLRAVRKKIKPEKYLRLDSYAHPFIYHIALAAYRNPHILEGEKLLDRRRWDFLDELEFGHYFDFEYLIIYAYKLLILERWERIETADKETLLKVQLSV